MHIYSFYLLLRAVLLSSQTHSSFLLSSYDLFLSLISCTFLSKTPKQAYSCSLFPSILLLFFGAWLLCSHSIALHEYIVPSTGKKISIENTTRCTDTTKIPHYNLRLLRIRFGMRFGIRFYPKQTQTARRNGRSHSLHNLRTGPHPYTLRNIPPIPAHYPLLANLRNNLRFDLGDTPNKPQSARLSATMYVILICFFD